MAVNGNLSEIILADLIQINCQEMKSARLTLEHRGYHGEMYFSDGQVAHAVQGSLSGIDAVAEMLKWRDGTFTAENEIRPPEHTIAIPWKDLMIEAMKHSAHVSPSPTSAETPTASDSLAALKSIDGVIGYVCAAPDGTVLAAEIPDGDGEREAAVTVFVGGAADQIGGMLALGALERGLMQAGSLRVLVFKQDESYVGLILREQASPALVATAVNQVLGKSKSS